MLPPKVQLSAERCCNSKQLRYSICETPFRVSPDSIFTVDPPGIPGQIGLRPAGGADGTHPFWTALENWGPEMYAFKWNGWKRSLDFINIQDFLLLLPESEKLKESLDSKCQVVKLGSYSPYNAGFYLNAGTTSSSRMALNTLFTNMAKVVAPNDGEYAQETRCWNFAWESKRGQRSSPCRNPCGWLTAPQNFVSRHWRAKPRDLPVQWADITKQNGNHSMNSLLMTYC